MKIQMQTPLDKVSHSWYFLVVLTIDSPWVDTSSL